MPVFEYTAVTLSGQRVAGVLNGASEQAILGELESRQLVPVAVAEQRARVALRFRRGVGVRALAESYQQLADLLKAGVPLLRGLRLLAARKSRPRLAAVFQEVAQAVADGSELAEAMLKRPDVFPKVHCAMVRAGEKGGFLEAVFARLGQFVGAQAELRAKVIGNLIYPAVLVAFGAVVLGIMFGVFIPMFEPLFDRMRDRLPLITRVVFAASGLVSAYGLLALAGAVALAIAARRALRHPRVARYAAAARTWMPVIGPLVRALAAARFCRMFGTMLGNGIPVIAAMQISREAAGNPLMEEAIEKATESVRSGQPLATPLGESGLFPDDVVEMISVGESANNLDDVLITIAETIERRIDRLLTAATRLIEPLLLLLIAGAVVVVALALILPMTQMRADM